MAFIDQTFLRHPKYGIGFCDTVTVIQNLVGTGPIKVLFVTGEKPIQPEDLLLEPNHLRGDPIDKFQGPTRWLSNFEAAPVTYDGLEYATNEHAYQAAKTLDPGERLKIWNLATPGQSRRAGQKVTLRSDWEAIKLNVMMELNFQKFTRHEHLRQKLLATGNCPLIEGNTWNDQFWGVCNGVGKNWLGCILMLIRANLRGKMKARNLPPPEIFDVLHAAEAAGVVLPESVDKWWADETWVRPECCSFPDECAQPCCKVD